MNSPKTDFERLMIIFILWNIALTFGSTLLYPYFKSIGISVFQMLLLIILNYLAPLIYLLFFRNYESRTSIAFGILSVGIAYSSLILAGLPAGTVLFYLIQALAFVFFWVPFNSMWFDIQSKKNAGHSTIYNSLQVLVSVLVPSIAGFIAQSFGFNIVFLLAILLFIICTGVAIRNAPAKRVSFGFIQSMRSIYGFKALFFIEGFVFMTSAYIPITSLAYFSRPGDFGLFLSTSSLFSILASFLMAHLSDNSGKRREFLIFASLGLGLSLIFAFWASSLLYWFIVVAVFGFFNAIFIPFPLAIVMDSKRNCYRVMYAREVMLNAGRVFSGLLALGLFLLFQSLQPWFLISGVSMLGYAFIFEFLKKKRLGII